MLKSIGSTVLWALAIAALLFFPIQNYVGGVAFVPSESMNPTIAAKDKLVVNKMVSTDDLEFGDIVVFESPVAEYEGISFVKRLIGKSGDTIEIKEGKLYINNKEIKESYIKEPMKYNFGPVIVPKDKFFFLGDNRNKSFDSHLWEDPFVVKDLIIGKASYRVQPFDKIGSFE